MIPQAPPGLTVHTKKKTEEEIIRNSLNARMKLCGPSPQDMRKRMLMASSKRGPTIITDNLVLGGRDDACSLSVLSTFGITHILNVAIQLPNSFPDNYIYDKIDLIDSSEVNIADFMPRAIDFLRNVEKVNGRALIHCVSGVSRSVTVLIMYLISAHRLTLKDTYDCIKSSRPYIAPNEGFKMQLVLFEVSELGYSSVTSADAGSDWKFYKLNCLRNSFPKADQSSGTSVSTTCCVM